MESTPQLHKEKERLHTFKNWSVKFISPEELARSGFFYCGYNCNQIELVKCFFCHVRLGNWDCDDDVVVEHLRWSQTCPLLRRHYTNNEPIDQEKFEQILPPYSYNVCWYHKLVK